MYRPPPPGPSSGAPATCHLHLQTTPMTWADAEAACARDKDGGHLVTITSEDEQAALEHFALNRLRQLPPGYPEGAATTTFSWLASQAVLTRVMRTGVWIGLSDTGGESYCRGQLFSWADGTQGADAHGHSYQHWVRQTILPILCCHHPSLSMLVRLSHYQLPSVTRQHRLNAHRAVSYRLLASRTTLATAACTPPLTGADIETTMARTGTIVILSRFVALSVSLTQKVSLFQWPNPTQVDDLGQQHGSS